MGDKKMNNTIWQEIRMINSDSFYWVYKNGELESTNCKIKKYRMINSYSKQFTGKTKNTLKKS